MFPISHRRISVWVHVFQTKSLWITDDKTYSQSMEKHSPQKENSDFGINIVSLFINSWHPLLCTQEHAIEPCYNPDEFIAHSNIAFI